MVDALECVRELIQVDKSSYDARLCGIDARIKLVVAGLGIFTVVFLERWIFALSIAAVCFLFALFSGIPAWRYLSRMLFPGLFAGFAVGGVIFAQGLEGVSFGVLIFTRVLAATSLLNLLTLVTPMTSLLDALSWLRLPRTLIDLTALMLRYIFLFADESVKLHNAMSARNAFSKTLSIRKRIENFSTLSGMLMIRSIEKARCSYTAMLARGYHPGSRIYVPAKRIPFKDIALGSVSVMLFAVLLVIDKW
ncbi:MAG: cobalt ECF transporter T component CbiQ [Candidatus Hydrothermarchaeales archaeon]